MKTKKIVNIVNFIRGEDWRFTHEMLHQTFINTLELCKQYPMPYTISLLYDALINPEYTTPLLENKDPNMEVGLWLELSRQAVENAGLEWNEEHDWTWHVNPGMLLGYNQPDRERIIDELMNRFKSVFGYYPASVGAWVIDTHSINYMKEKYDVKAVCFCREQYGTDGYTLWGGYYNQGYFPSKKNMFMPAQSKEEQTNVPLFRMLGPDPIYEYDLQKYGNYRTVPTLEPAWRLGQDEKWVDWYLDSHYGAEGMAFSYTQTGQENSFGWDSFGVALKMQMDKVYEGMKEGKWEVMTLRDTGIWFSETFETTPATSITALTDWQEENQRQTVWYNCKNYRFDMHNENGKICVRDINLFDENYTDRYLETPAPGDDATFDALPIIDGYLWRGDGELSALYFVKKGTEEKVDGKLLASEAEGENALKITFELEGKKAFCLCDEEKVRFELPGGDYDMLFKYNELRNTKLEEIGENSVKYEHENMSYALNLTCKVSAEENGYRISPEGDSLELSFKRLGNKEF